MDKIGRIGVIGAGIIGASWAALFLAHGHDVAVHDPALDAEDGLRGFVRHARAQLADLGRTGQGRLSRWMSENDRGEFVRTPEELEALASPYFGATGTEVVSGAGRIPGAYVLMTLSDAQVSGGVADTADNLGG